MVLDGLPGLYGLKYDSATACGLPLYLCSYKLVSSVIADLTEVFKALKVYRWKLNPTKCIFGVPSGILLGNIVSRHGIKANLEKIAVVTNMKPPTCLKDVQKLTGCMPALSRFISHLGEKGLPFFKLLKAQVKFV